MNKEILTIANNRISNNPFIKKLNLFNKIDSNKLKELLIEGLSTSFNDETTLKKMELNHLVICLISDAYAMDIYYKHKKEC